MKNAPLVTKIRRFIIKTSIDELPQLWNVLKGENEFGRPEITAPKRSYTYTEYDKQRLLVAPGCTELWQVSGKSNVGFKENEKNYEKHILLE